MPNTIIPATEEEDGAMQTWLYGWIGSGLVCRIV